MIYLTLFLEFFKTGLFAIGGGMATLPFLYELTKYGWYTMPELMDMIAVAESTPGPIGVNMATYAGFSAGGLLGGIIATFGLVLPSVIVVVLVYKVLEKFKGAPIVENAFYGLRPAVAGMIVVACSELFKLSILNAHTIINIKASILFLIIAIAIMKFKKVHPIVFILFGALFGIIFKL